MTASVKADPHDPAKRREILATRPNPGENVDSVVTLEGRIEGGTGVWTGNVQLRYVPDRLILTPESFTTYTRALALVEWRALEEIAVAILDDVNNEVVARWTRLTVRADPKSGLAAHSVTIEDQQPHWNNSTLLNGLQHY